MADDRHLLQDAVFVDTEVGRTQARPRDAPGLLAVTVTGDGHDIDGAAEGGCAAALPDDATPNAISGQRHGGIITEIASTCMRRRRSV